MVVREKILVWVKTDPMMGPFCPSHCLVTTPHCAMESAMRDRQLRQTIQDRALEIIGAFVRVAATRQAACGLMPFSYGDPPLVFGEPRERRVSLFWLWRRRR